MHPTELGGGTSPRQALSLHPGPLGEGLRPGLGGETPPASPSRSPRQPGFYGAANPTRGVLETWWANPGPNPSNGPDLQLHAGGGCRRHGDPPARGLAVTVPSCMRAGMPQACGPSCVGPRCDSARALGVPLAVLALRLSVSERLAGTGGCGRVGSWVPAGSRQKPRGHWGRLRDPGELTLGLGSGPAGSQKPGQRTTLEPWPRRPTIRVHTCMRVCECVHVNACA